MVLHKYETGVCPSYLAPDFLSVSSKSFSNKQLPNTVYLKSLTLIWAPSSLFQSSHYKGTSPPLPNNPGLKKLIPLLKIYPNTSLM